MRVPINLASQPYENLRPLYVAACFAALLFVGLILTVAWRAQQNRDQTRVLAEQSEHLQKDLAGLQREQRDLTLWLGQPEVQEIRDRSTFLNSLIVRKSLSWTQMFMDLEKVLPDKVQVAAIRPSANESEYAQLKLSVASPSIAPLVDFLKNLEAAPQFSKPVVDSQRYPVEKAQDPNITLDLGVLYHQSGAASSSAPPESDQLQSHDGGESEPSSAGLDNPVPLPRSRGSDSQKGAR